MYPVIFDEEDVIVKFDDDPLTDLPIYVEGGDWIQRDAALKLAGAILAALDAKVEVATVGSLNETILGVASDFDKEVQFSYAKGTGAVLESRRLVPAEVKEVKGHRLVIGFDPDRSDVRAYRLDRIKGDVALV